MSIARANEEGGTTVAISSSVVGAIAQCRLPSGINPPSVGGVPGKTVEVVLSVGDVRQAVDARDMATIDRVADDAVTQLVGSSVSIAA